MHERVLPASPNWYCCSCCDTSQRGVMGVGARNSVYLMDVAGTSCRVVGTLCGHKERVSGFSFCHHPGQDHLCVSSSDDGTVKFWDSSQQLLMKEHMSHQGTIVAVQWSPADQHLVVSGDDKGVVVCYRYNTGDSLSFVPLPKNLFSLSCCPVTWNLVALGYKQGLILLVDVAKKGEVLHRLRGHDDEIHSLAWSPSRPPSSPGGEEGPGLGEEAGEVAGGGCYLASGSRDQTIRVWNTASGRGVMTLKLPYLKKRGGGGASSGPKDRLWLNVHWPRGRPCQLVSTCFSGELILWDLNHTSKQKWSLLGSSSDQNQTQNHSRIVFNMTSVCLPDGQELLISTSMDREIKCWDLVSLECVWTVPTLGGSVYALSFSPVATGCLALGGADQMIRTWNTMSLTDHYDTRTFWQGVKSKITALCWHPSKEVSLAFGTDDGKVGIYDTFSNKPPKISSSYHRKTVYRLAWGPELTPTIPGEFLLTLSEQTSSRLYSCAGEGVILQHDPWNLGSEATDIDKLIRDTNSIKHKMSPHSDFSWKPDGKVVAIGNEDGSIDVYAAPHLKHLCSVQQHHKIINTLQWYHPHAPQQPQLHALLASGSSSAKVYVHDLCTLIETPVEPPLVITEPFRTLGGHTAKITGLSWSPHHAAHLATVSYDRTAQVWDVLKEAGLVNYRGHGNRVMCVEWSPVDPNVVWTGADDFTVHEWQLSRQEFTVPPKGKKILELREKSKAKQKKGNMAASGPAERETAFLNGERETTAANGERETTAANGERESTAANGERETTAANGERETTAANGERETTAADGEREMTVADGERETTAANGERGQGRSDAEEQRTYCPSLGPAVERVMKPSPSPSPTFSFTRIKDKPDILSLKKRKMRSILPLSTAMDHRTKEELLQDCVTLATIQNSPAPPAGCVPGQGQHLHLGLFSDRHALYSMLQEEEEGHLASGHPDSVVYLRLWTGDLAGALQSATERGELSDHLLALAPMAGYGAWRAAVDAYIRQLCLQEQHLKAASYLLSINQLEDAVMLLLDHRLYREAVVMVKANLPPEHPLQKQVLVSWASALEKDGHLSAAAKCYLAAGEGFDAAKVVSKKSDVVSLRTGAMLAQLSGESELARTLALRCAKDLAAELDWVGAQEVLSTQGCLLIHRLCFCVAEILSTALKVSEGVTSHCWCTNDRPSGPLQDHPQDSGPLQNHPRDSGRLQDHIRRVWDEELGVGPGSEVSSLLQDLRALENTHLSPNSSAQQVVTHVSVSLSLAVLNWLNEDDDEVMKDVWQAAAWPRDAGLFTMSAQLCGLLFPDDCCFLFSLVFPGVLCPTSERSVAARTSLQAFLDYNLLYRRWWGSANREPDGRGRARLWGDLSIARVHQEELLTDATRTAGLLSEVHAEYQAAQRTVAQIQERLTGMVVRHNRDHPEQEQRSEEESLLSLSSKMAEYQRRLSETPDTVKMFPHPDVLECCLVLLHLARCSTLVSDGLQETARELLRKHATSPASQRAARRFLT